MWRRKGRGVLVEEYYDENDEIDDLLLMLAIRLKYRDEYGTPTPSKIPPHKIDEYINVIVKNVNALLAKQTLYEGLLYLCHHAGDPFSRYVALRCYVAFQRLKVSLDRFDEMYRLCSSALKFAELALNKYKLEEAPHKEEDREPEGYV